MVLLGVGGWWFMQPGRSNFLSRAMRKLFTSPKLQKAFLIGEDGVVHADDYRIIAPGYIENKDSTGVWHQVQVLMLKCQGMKRHVLLLTERNTIPFNPFVVLPPSKLEKIRNTEAIAAEGATRAIDEAVKHSKNNMIASALVICACAVVLVFLVFMGFQWWQNGGTLPGMGG